MTTIERLVASEDRSQRGHGRAGCVDTERLNVTGGTDLRASLRAGASDAELQELIRGVWQARTDRYSEVRSEATIDLPKVEMSYIGG